MDTPWDWCSGVSSSSIESAQAHVCLNTYSYGSTSGSSSTNGWISYDTLENLISVLNQIPKDAFTPDRMSSKETYRNFFLNQQVENGSISVIDGVNNMAVVINFKNGKVTMLLTDDMEKVQDNSHTYLEPTQVWAVEDPALAEFMHSITLNPPVISYSVGAEYEWQAPLDFAADRFSLELRLLEGWEYEYVTNDTDSGIRCRPEGINDGWIYFSYWPNGFSLEEKDRYYTEGMWSGFPMTKSYPSSVKSTTGFDTRHAIWSYELVNTDIGDFAIINDGADNWFLEYEDQISDTLNLLQFTTE